VNPSLIGTLLHEPYYRLNVRGLNPADGAEPDHSLFGAVVCNSLMIAANAMTAPAEDALELQRPLADDALMIVARSEKQDEGSLAA
jgi:hypothetical protein